MHEADARSPGGGWPDGAGSSRALDSAPVCKTDEDCLFAQGYLNQGGTIVYLRHLLDDVRPCEGEWGVAYDNGYITAFQFAPSSWSRAALATGYTDPLNPYHVGRNVAWWIAHIDDPGSSAGWPSCWWRGLVP